MSLKLKRNRKQLIAGKCNSSTDLKAKKEISHLSPGVETLFTHAWSHLATQSSANVGADTDRQHNEPEPGAHLTR